MESYQRFYAVVKSCFEKGFHHPDDINELRDDLRMED